MIANLKDKVRMPSEPIPGPGVNRPNDVEVPIQMPLDIFPLIPLAQVDSPFCLTLPTSEVYAKWASGEEDRLIFFQSLGACR